MADKVQFRMFMLPEYEQEEIYLNKMAKKGYRLDKVVIPGFYFFTKTEPENMIYKIDFNPQKDDSVEEYHQMFADYGWEYLQDMNEYSYFRKISDGTEEDIYSDNASRIEMIKRILMTKMLPFMILFLCIVIPQFFMALFRDDMGNAGITLLILWTLVLALYVFIFTRCTIGFYRLKKKYNAEG